MNPMTTPTPTGGLTSTTPFRSGNLRAQLTITLLAANAVLSLLMIVSEYLQINLLNDALAGVEISQERATLNDLRVTAIGLLKLITYVATVVMFSTWIHRAYGNLPALGNQREGLEYSPRWAVGGFFIPFANLVVPYKVTREIWTKSDPAIRGDDDFMFAQPATAALVGAWWAFWIISNVADNIVFRLSRNAETAESMLWVTKLNIGAALLEIPAAILAILVVREINRRQEERSKHVNFVPWQPPPPPLPTQYAATDARPQS